VKGKSPIEDGDAPPPKPVSSVQLPVPFVVLHEKKKQGGRTPSPVFFKTRAKLIGSQYTLHKTRGAYILFYTPSPVLFETKAYFYCNTLVRSS
jgi:hypothetical protein